MCEATVTEHVFEVRRFLAWLKEEEVALKDVSRTTVRSYLKRFEGYAPSTYANVLKNLKRFLRDFRQRPEMVSSFKFPDNYFSPKVIPSKEDLRRF